MKYTFCMYKVLLIAMIMIVFVGCSPVHFTVTSAPIRPEDTGRFAVYNPGIPVGVQIANFEIRKVDTQYPEKEKELFRQHFSIAIPNMLQEFLGKRQVFREVTRVATPKPDQSDYIITGIYDFYERLGTRGREWIPFAGLFGAPINEATIRGKLSLRIIDAKSGSIIFEKDFTEEHSEKTSIYKKANVGYLQANHLGMISSEIIRAISAHYKSIQKNK